MSAMFTQFDPAWWAANYPNNGFRNNDPIAQAESLLISQRVFQYEIEHGKIDMTNKRGEGWMGMFWSTDAGYVMNEYRADHLRYIVPDEGGNLWINNLVVPSTARNARLANKFIAFTLTREIAKMNTSFTGSPAANHAAMVELEKEMRDDAEIWIGTSEGFKENLLELMFPPMERMNSLFTLSDLGSRHTDLVNMWNNVRRAG